MADINTTRSSPAPVIFTDWKGERLERGDHGVAASGNGADPGSPLVATEEH
jgi:hypothetical protein